jgi:hypothetical protein
MKRLTTRVHVKDSEIEVDFKDKDQLQGVLNGLENPGIVVVKDAMTAEWGSPQFTGEKNEVTCSF